MFTTYGRKGRTLQRILQPKNEDVPAGCVYKIPLSHINGNGHEINFDGVEVLAMSDVRRDRVTMEAIMIHQTGTFVGNKADCKLSLLVPPDKLFEHASFKFLSFKTLEPQNKYLTKNQSDIMCKSATKAEVRHDLEENQSESVISHNEIARDTLKKYLSLPKSESFKETQTDEVLEKSLNKLSGRAIINALDKTIRTVLKYLLILQESSDSRVEPIPDSGRMIKEVSNVKSNHWLTSTRDDKEGSVIQED
ncbi:hypothetical protein ACOME3_004410 [Neoechinorhynchus agilis]